MAQYSFHGQIIGRGSRARIGGDGKAGEKTASRASVVASAAYRAGACLRDDLTGLSHDYTHKGGVVYSSILLPENAPERFHDRQTLWNAVQKTETRKDAQLSREIRVALPRELTREQNIKLLEDYLEREFISRGMVADVAYHDPKGSNHNPHAHIMLTLRPFTRSGNWRAQKGREWNSGDLYGGWREGWARAANEHLEQAGIAARIDHRSYAERELPLIPTHHLGKDAAALERSGVMTEKGNFNRTVRACNELAGLGIEPDGLRDSLREIGDRVRERQRGSRKARAVPEREAAPLPSSPGEVPEPVAEPKPRALSDGSSPAGRDDQRRTDTSLRDVCGRGIPCTPEKDEGATLSSEKEPLRRLDSPAAPAVGGRSYAPVEARDVDALRHSTEIRRELRDVVRMNNFMVEHDANSHTDILLGIKNAQAAIESCRDNSREELRKMDREIARLEQLEQRLGWIYEYGTIALQLDQLKLFPGKFYQKHKNEIDRYRFAVRELKNAGFSEPDNTVGCAARLEEQIKALERKCEKQIEKTKEEIKPLYRELRLWCSCEEYIRDLLGLPKPSELPRFPEKLHETSLQKKLREIRAQQWQQRDQRQSPGVDRRRDNEPER